MSGPRWLSRLTGAGRCLAPLPGGRAGHGVYAGQDRRRRPLAVLAPGEARAALSAGLIEADGPDCWRITEAGRARVRRDQASGETAFADQHREMGVRTVIEPDGRLRAAMADLAASPLARYAKAGRIEAVHAAAGAQLRADYEGSALRSAVTSDWTRPPRGRQRGAPHDPTAAPDRMVQARTRVMDALAAAGPGFDRLLVNICLRETGMAAAERALDWPERSGLPALRLALDRLAVHYRLKRPERVVDPFG